MANNEFDKDKVVVRLIEADDVEAAAALSYKVFGSEMSLSYENIKSIQEIFPEGQACVEYDGKIVGSALSLIVDIDDYPKEHTYDEITGEGYIRNHNPNGKNLYGIEVGVDPDYRGLAIGRRLYEKRQEICQKFNLESILIGGRIPDYHKYADELTPDEYVQKVVQGELTDPVVTFQLKNGFEFVRVLPNYLPGDPESLDNAVLLEWKNPLYKKQ